MSSIGQKRATSPPVEAQQNKRDAKLNAKTLDKNKGKKGKSIPATVKMISPLGSGLSTLSVSPRHDDVSFLTLNCSLGETKEEEKEVSFLRIF